MKKNLLLTISFLSILCFNTKAINARNEEDMKNNPLGELEICNTYKPNGTGGSTSTPRNIGKVCYQN
jgi:hypothetical protein